MTGYDEFGFLKLCGLVENYRQLLLLINNGIWTQVGYSLVWNHMHNFKIEQAKLQHKFNLKSQVWFQAKLNCIHFEIAFLYKQKIILKQLLHEHALDINNPALEWV